MLELLRIMETEGRWADIRQVGPDIAASLEGDQRARCFLSMSAALEKTANGVADYKAAASYAQLAVSAATPGSLLYTWSLARSAAMMCDVGRYADAEQAALGFLALLPTHPQAAPMEPYAWFALGRVYSRQGRHGAAFSALRRALDADPGVLSERIQLTMARAYARAGMIRSAGAALPVSVDTVDAGKLHAARALVAAAAGDWITSETEGRAALPFISGWQVFDVVEVAELLLTLKRAAAALGRFAEAGIWLMKVATLLAGLDAGLMRLLLLTRRPEGGVRYREETSSCGSAGDDRCGLRGTVG